VIMSVCPHNKTKTAETKMVKLGSVINIRLKGYRVTECKNILKALFILIFSVHNSVSSIIVQGVGNLIAVITITSWQIKPTLTSVFTD